jgi:hypothetical protein
MQYLVEVVVFYVNDTNKCLETKMQFVKAKLVCLIIFVRTTPYTCWSEYILLFFVARKLPKCKNFIRNYRKQTQGAPIQLLYSVQNGDDIRMTCHYW